MNEAAREQLDRQPVVIASSQVTRTVKTLIWQAERIEVLEAENAELWEVVHNIAAGAAAPMLRALSVVNKYGEPK